MAVDLVARGGAAAEPSIERLSGAIAAAHNVYLERRRKRRWRQAGGRSGEEDGEEDVSVVFVVQPNERNVVDQRLLELALWRNHKVPVRRLSLADIDAAGPAVNEEEGTLHLRVGGVVKRGRW